MVMYLIPDDGDFTEINTVASRVKMGVVSATKVRDVVAATLNEVSAIVVCPPEVLAILTRHAAQLFEDTVPTVLTSVPGLIYSGGWMANATVFPPMHFKDFEETYKRSGAMGLVPSDVEDLGKGASTPDLPSSDLLTGPGDAE
nr:MAG: hypothetical protein 1 [Zhejiang cysto-like virus]